MNGLIHRWIQNLDRLLGSGGTFYTTRGSRSMGICLRDFILSWPLCQYCSLLPICHEVNNFSLPTLLSPCSKHTGPSEHGLNSLKL
jgi:hypothetical protein